jgi:hypothetical protein
VSECVAGARLELLAEAKRRGALLGDRRVELVGLGGDLRLDVGDALAHALLERGHRSMERVLGALEVGLPGAKPFLDPLLDGRDELGHLVGELALTHAELAAALVGQAALLGHVRGQRVGLRTGDGDAELLGLRRRLLLRSRADHATRFGHELLGAGVARPRAPQPEDEPGAEDESRRERRDEDPGERRHEATLESERNESGREHDRRGREEAEPALLGCDQAIGVEPFPRAIPQLELAVDRGDAPAHEAHVVRERSLCEREEDRERRGEERGDAQISRDRCISTDRGEATPGEPEPEVGVEAAAEELEVVCQDEEHAERHEDDEPRLEGDRTPDADRTRDADRERGQSY